MDRCRSVAEQRPCADGQNRGEELAGLRQSGVPDRVDASMHAVQPTGLKPTGNAGVTDAERLQLIDRHQPVLAPRQRRNGDVGR